MKKMSYTLVLTLLLSSQLFSANFKTSTNHDTTNCDSCPSHDYAFLGIYSNTISNKKAKILGFETPYGSYITSVIGNTAAEKGGLQAFDYVYGIDEYRTGEDQKLGHILKRFNVGDQATVQFIRNGQKRSSNITFVSRSEAKYKKRDNCQKAFLGIRNNHESSTTAGVPVDIVNNSTAQAMGLKDGDVITRINGYRMVDWHDITAAIGLLNAGDNIEVSYLRGGQELTQSEAIKSRCDEREYEYEEREDEEEYEEETYSYSGSDNERLDRMDLNNVSVDMEDMTEEESREMKDRYNIDMPVVNNLSLQELKLFPNPSRGMFRLQFDLPERGNTSIKVFNAMGRLIYDYELGPFQGDFSDDLDISQNGPGNYFIQIRQDNKVVTKKIVIVQS